MTNRELVAAKVFEALGEASVCWERMEGTGVFDSVRATRVGDQLIRDIERIYTEETT